MSEKKPFMNNISKKNNNDYVIWGKMKEILFGQLINCFPAIQREKKKILFNESLFRKGGGGFIRSYFHFSLRIFFS